MGSTVEDTSASLRGEGNRFFEMAQSSLLPNQEKASRISHAIDCYEKALRLAKESQEIAPCLKNLGLAHEWRSKLLLQGGDVPNALSAAVKSNETRIQALSAGTECRKDAAWMNGIGQALFEFAQVVLDSLSQVELSQRFVPLFKFAWSFGERSSNKLVCQAAFLANQSHADALFKHIVTQNEKAERDFLLIKRTLPLLRDVYPSLQRAETFLACLGVAPHDPRSMQLGELRSQVFVQQCIMESSQARYQAEAMLEEQLKERESVDFQVVWDIIDLLSNSISLAKGDVDSEIISSAVMGRIFYRVLKESSRGHSLCRTALARVDSTGKDFSAKPWYKEAEAIVEDWKAQHPEESTDDPEIKEIHTKWGALERKEFLKWLYEKYPPKKPGHTLPAMDSNAIRTAVTHYHPDKNRTFGDRWKLVCTEITKCLNSSTCFSFE